MCCSPWAVASTLSCCEFKHTLNVLRSPRAAGGDMSAPSGLCYIPCHCTRSALLLYVATCTGVSCTGRSCVCSYSHTDAMPYALGQLRLRSPHTLASRHLNTSCTAYTSTSIMPKAVSLHASCFVGRNVLLHAGLSTCYASVHFLRGIGAV